MASELKHGEMAAAYFIGHAPQGYFFSPMMNQGESAVLFCFIFLFLSVAGTGAWSIDNRNAQNEPRYRVA